MIEPRDPDDLVCDCRPGRCSAKQGCSLLLAAAVVVVAGLGVFVAYLLDLWP